MEARRDVRAELRVAHLLLADRRIELAFEAYGSTKRGPDFTVTFRGERSFNLEVTRPRRAADAAGFGGPLLAKIRSCRRASRMPSSSRWRVARPMRPTCRGCRSLRDRADEGTRLFATRGFRGTREFYERYLRLGGVLVWSEAAIGDARAAIWEEPVDAHRAARAGRASVRRLPSSRLRHGQKRKRVGSFEMSVQAMTFRGLIAIAPFDR